MEAQQFAGRSKWRWVLSEYLIVVLGVVTALAAQQSVEWLHNSEKRRQLQEDLREEMRTNDAQLRDDIEFCSTEADWSLDQAQRIQAALHTNNTASLTYEPLQMKGRRHLFPNDSVWQHARESGTASLLPREQAQCYTLLYRVRESVVDSYKDFREARLARSVITSKFAQTRDGSPNLSQMTPAQLDELSTALAREAVTCRSEIFFLGSMIAAQNVLEHGSTSQEEISKAIFDSRNPAPTPANPISTKP